MAATLTFKANTFTISGLSGLALFGSAFANSVKVGQYQDTTYISDGNGTVQGPLVTNVKYFNEGSGYINSQAPTGLKYIPNYLHTLEILFQNDTAVKTQNVLFYSYDRANVANNASGVIVKIAEIVHPDTNQSPTGSGSANWTTLSGIVGAPTNSISLYPSPGISGIYNNTASARADTSHSNFVILSASPITVGSKSQWGAYVSLEYL